MKKKISPQLWWYFVSGVFIILVSTALFMAFLALMLFHFGWLTKHDRGPLLPMFFLLSISVIMGTFISFLVARKILKPVTKFSEASNEIARGNFDIRMVEFGRIPELNDLASNFNIMAAELSSIETLRNDFVTNVSHEFKTPIAAIEGYSTLLQDTSLSEAERLDYTQTIIESVRQLAALSGNILSLSKLETADAALAKNRFRLDEQIRQVILLLENEWNTKKQQIQPDLAALTYLGDENLLMLVWKNLIENAVKFTPPGGLITIRMQASADAVSIAVIDEGCGMDETTVRHAFDKFYQGDTARKTSGNGLGLALTKRIVDLHHGSINVASEINKGTSFTVRLPLSDSL